MHINKMEFKPTSQNGLISGMYKNTSYTETENGALTFDRTGSLVLDFFAQAGSMRGNKDKALELFKKAFAEDRQLSIRSLFYLRDIRGGQGERDLFRNCLEWLADNEKEIFESIIEFVSEYGRWDDLFFDNDKCFEIIKNQLNKDKENDLPSLLAKWLPTINASSKQTKSKARFIASKLGLKEVEYRKLVRSLRKKLEVVEEKMSANNWNEIEYSKVPSQANRIYRNAFKKHDEKRYNEFLEKVEKGEIKINSATLYPYQIYKSAQNDYSKSIDVLWNNLPDYTQGKNALVVADTSGSMCGDPMSVSISLALYFAERNKGQFKDYFLTFSSNPKLQKIVGKNLIERMNSIETGEVSNTNLQETFDLVLNTAIQNNVSQEEMPETIYVISDMEFDSAEDGETNFEVIKRKYDNYGYKMPNLVFWNVNASGSNLPVQKNERGVTLVSGFSPSVFKLAVENKTPYNLMIGILNSERYSKIKI